MRHSCYNCSLVYVRVSVRVSVCQSEFVQTISSTIVDGFQNNWTRLFFIMISCPAVFSKDLYCRPRPFLDRVNRFKGGYLDFSHLTELENIYISEIYMKKQCKSSITNNHKIKQIKFFDGVPLRDYVAS